MANPFEVQTLNPLQALLVGGQSYDASQKSAQKAQMRGALQSLLAGDGSFDPKGAAGVLLQGDDPSAAVSFLNLANTQERNKLSDSRDARDFAFRQAESARAQSNADRSYGLQVRSQDRADEDQYSIQKVDTPDGQSALIRVKKRGAEGPIPLGQTPDAIGPNNPFSDGGKYNGDQGKAAGFTDRMLQSESILRGRDGSRGVQGQGTNVVQSGIDAIPYVPDAVKNATRSNEYQKFDQARRDFVNAQLRRESGAAISQGEYDSANKQYFPLPGDGPEVIAQKAANRRSAIEAMGREGGPSYRPKSVFTGDGRIVTLPARGELRDGYRYKGGDPSDQNSWVKMP